MPGLSIIWRWWSGGQAHPEAEVADLQKVVAQYPQSRDARRELGISYLPAARYQEAIEQFEALQAIDPDDLAAHYNLAILYRRVGDEGESGGTGALVRHQAGRSRRADLLAGFPAQSSGDFDRERAVAHAYDAASRSALPQGPSQR